MNSGGENEVDLDLQAFRYVGNELGGNELGDDELGDDELGDDELQRFEGRLAEDQAAREAVARVVQIGQAVAFSGPPVTRGLSLKPSGRRAQRRRRLWAIVASSIAAAFLAGVGVAQWFDLNSRQSSPTASSEPGRFPDGGVNDVDSIAVKALNGSAGYVLALWSESAAEFGQFAEELASDAQASQDGGGEPLEMALAASDSWVLNDDTEFDLPSWMLAAVSPDEEPGASPPDSTPPSQEN